MATRQNIGAQETVKNIGTTRLLVATGYLSHSLSLFRKLWIGHRERSALLPSLDVDRDYDWLFADQYFTSASAHDRAGLERLQHSVLPRRPSIQPRLLSRTDTHLVIVSCSLDGAIVFGFHRFKRQDLYKQITPVVNVILIALVLSQIVNLASKSTSVSTIAQSLSTTSALNADNLEIPKINDSAEHPDIYYIIPDGYPSDLWLQDSMNYDNARFTEALEDRGFTVVPHAQSNYAATLLSLASVLNMQHYQSNPTPLGDLDYLRLSIADSRVARQLLQLGYSYVQFLSGYLIPSPIADINRDFTRGGAIDIGFGQNDFSVEILNETSEGVRDPNELGHFYKQSFISLYLDTTLLRIVRAQLEELIGEDNSAPLALFARQRFLDTITEMETLVRMPEATFAIIHLMKPHGPLTFNEQGEGVNETWNPSHQEYFAEFQFTNAKFLEMIDTILQGSDHEPIIIFQADHSTLYGLVWTEDWRLIHFDPYFALFLPESYEFSFPKPFTLINTFPIILNEFFGTEIEMQSNLLLELLVGYDAPFEQKDVTEIFAHK